MGRQKEKNKNQNKAASLLKKAVALFLRENAEAALKTVDELISQYKEEPMAYYLRGEILLRLGRKSEALSSFREALRLEPYNFAAAYRLAQLLEEKGDFKEALFHYKKVSFLYPWAFDIETKLEELKERTGKVVHLAGATEELRVLFRSIEDMGKKNIWVWKQGFGEGKK